MYVSAPANGLPANDTPFPSVTKARARAVRAHTFSRRIVNRIPLPPVIPAMRHQLAKRDTSMPTTRSTLLASLLLFLVGCAPANALQPAKPPIPAAPVPIANESDLADTRAQLIRLLRMSPTLSEVVANDPSLLANQDYVNRNNPELGKFLESHPEVARNPDFYLFADLPNGSGRRVDRLERRIWQPNSNPGMSEVVRELFSMGAGFLAFFSIAGILLWLTRAFLENRRWARVFK